MIKIIQNMSFHLLGFAIALLINGFLISSASASASPITISSNWIED